MPISLQVNGQQHDVDVSPDTPLLWVLRDVIGLTGTKYGCGIAACGACTVHVDGEAVRSCITAVGDVADAGGDDRGARPDGNHPVQRAWRDHNVPAVRLLPVRPDHARGGVPGLDQEPDRRADQRGHGRQHLPLRLLPAHPCGREGGGHGSVEAMTNARRHRECQPPPLPVSAATAAGFVVALQFVPLRSALVALRDRRRRDAARRRSTTRTSSSRSTATAPSPSSATARRWAPAPAPACR